MSAQLEIERKFLVKYPDIDSLDVRRRASIIQTYLNNGKNGSQRRVREITENNTVKHTYTEKIFLDPAVREENERVITEEEYNVLLSDKKSKLRPIKKVRYCFNYHEQNFELDTYPFSDKLAIMELELDSIEQNIDFPDNVCVLKDVTGDSSYSNSSLANAGAFPEECDSYFLGELDGRKDN